MIRDPEQAICDLVTEVKAETLKLFKVAEAIKTVIPNFSTATAAERVLAFEIYCLKEGIRLYAERQKIAPTGYATVNLPADHVFPESGSDMIMSMFPDKNMLDMPLSKHDPADMAGFPKLNQEK